MVRSGVRTGRMGWPGECCIPVTGQALLHLERRNEDEILSTMLLEGIQHDEFRDNGHASPLKPPAARITSVSVLHGPQIGGHHTSHQGLQHYLSLSVLCIGWIVIGLIFAQLQARHCLCMVWSFLAGTQGKLLL